jgi:serine/threonine protein kinase/FixJ family two-component response regulator
MLYPFGPASRASELRGARKNHGHLGQRPRRDMNSTVNKPGILVVDHDGQSLQETKQLLEEQGFRVYTASDGLAALEEFKRQQPSMVILAAMLPKLHGFEVCRSIKKTAGGAGVPVIITTKLNKNEKYKLQAMQKFKADDFLVKPLSAEKLLGLVRHHLGRSNLADRARPAPRPAEDRLEQILEDTLAGLMRGDPLDGRAGRGELPLRRPPGGGRLLGSPEPDGGSGRAERDPRWDAREENPDWDDDGAVVPSAPSALAEVDEDEIDRIVDNLDFFADDNDAGRGPAFDLSTDAMDMAADRMRGSLDEGPAPRAPARGAAPRPAAEAKPQAGPTVAVTPMEMARSREASKPDPGRPTVAVTPVEMARGAQSDADPLRIPGEPIEEGQLFGKFLLLRKIATGGMAEVFRAKQIGVEGFEKLVALKRILPHLTDNDEFIKMFIDEGKLAAQLTHTNIVQIYELGEVDHSYYIAMEYVHGKNLKQILHRAKQMGLPMTIEKAVTIASKVCKALDYAHRKCDMSGTPLNLVHRDVSPQNILISYEGEVKLVDFGIAKAASQASITRAGALKGKILYMSPEQAWGKPIDLRSDIYSVGNLLYEMITDRKLFSGQTEVEILKKVRDPKIQSPSSHVKDLPAELEKIILKALHVDPDKRHQDAGSMKRALDKFLFKRKVALGALNLGSYVQNLFQDEFQQDTAESLAQVDLPSLVLSDIDMDEDEDEGLSAEAPAPAASRGRAESGRAVRSRRQAEAASSDSGVSGSDVFDRTMLSPQGAPTWLYVMILAVVLLVGLLVYMLIPRTERASLRPGEEGATLLQPKPGIDLDELESSITAPATADPLPVSPSSEPPVVSHADPPSVVPSVEPPPSVEAAALPPPLVEAAPEPPAQAPAPRVEPTPVPTRTPRPTATAKPSPTPRAPRPTQTPRPVPRSQQPVVGEPAAAATSVPEARVTAPTPEIVYGDAAGAVPAPEQGADSGTVVIKRAEPRASPEPPAPISAPAEPRPQPTVPRPEPVAPVQPPPGPARENDLVEFPDTALEFVEQGSVVLSSDLRRKLKKALGKETVTARFFVRAEISIRGQVTRVDSVLKGVRDVPQLVEILTPEELSAFDDAFIKAAKDSRFKPLFKDGVKVRSVQTVFLQVRVP